MKSLEAGDSVEVSNSYTSDAILMAPNKPSITGRENITHFFSNFIAKGISDFDLRTLLLGGDSSILAEDGTCGISDKKKNQIDNGKYIVLWKPQAGNWKMYCDIWASDIPLPKLSPKNIFLPK